ncbi:hypothetical protein [Actinoplanes philippinensis]|uniref:hypothetical protein n=1 Tax=Actinoplanes philippinensis TaxID=35752 RepID=UPI0019405FA6|nr:hypothetical protein [Actinoplanes philippinensis]
MRSTEAHPGSTPVIGSLLATGSALIAAFVFAPAALLGGAVSGDAVGRGLAEYWRSGGPRYPALLAALVDHWFRWHAIKVVISSLIIVVFALLAVALWRRYLHGAAGHAAGAIGATVFTVLATGLLILNIQATAVPLVALLPMPAAGESGPVPHEIRAALTGPAGGPPALTVLLGEVERYHWVMVATAATVLAALAPAGAALWRRRGAGDARLRFLRRTLSVLLTVTASLLLLLVVAGALSAAAPGDTLLTVLAPA